MIGGALSGRTWLHRVSAPTKLLAMAAATVVMFALDDPAALVLVAAGVAALYATLGRRGAARLRLFAPLAPIVLAIALLQAWSLGWPAAVAAVARLAAMIMVADLVTATTPMLAMMDTIAPLLAPLRLVGLDARRLSLAFALVLRFVPVLLDDWRKREEAWRARTGRRASIRLLAPWAADLLRLADRVSEAIDARGFGGGSR